MIEVKQTITTASGEKLEISRRGISWTPGERSIGGCSQKEWGAILARAWHWAGEYWHREILPRHFTHAGAAEYGYKPRHFKYTRYKLKRYGHTYPLVFRGDMKRAVLRTEDVRSDQKGARIVLHGPTYLYAYRKFNKRLAARYRRRGSHRAGTDEARYRLQDQPDKAYELSTISSRDAEAVARVLDRGIEQLKAARIGGAGHQGEAARDPLQGHRAG